MTRVILFLIVLIIIALIVCLFAFWRMFNRFRDIYTYNTKTLIETIKKDREVIKDIEKEIGRLKDTISKMSH